MNLTRRDGKAIVAIILMLVFAGAAYFIMTLLVKDKQSDAAEEAEQVATERGEVSVERANEIVQKAKNTLKAQKQAVDDRLKKNLGS